jgi:TolA-binding protein
MTTTSATEPLAAAEARHAQVLARLEAARIARDELRATLAKTRETYLADSAAAELEGSERPPRARLTELEQQLPDAEDRIAVLERAVDEAARQVRHARADVLDADAAAVREETTRRQARIHVLQPQVEAMQREIHEHSAWIANAGPVSIQKLETEAHRLRSTP